MFNCITAALPQDGVARVSLTRRTWLSLLAASGLALISRPDDAAWRQMKFMVFDMPSQPGNLGMRLTALMSLAALAANRNLVGVRHTQVTERGKEKNRAHAAHTPSGMPGAGFAGPAH